jgi:hypothetical protein
MAAGGYVRYNIWGEPKKMNKRYWLWQAACAYDWLEAYPEMRWKQLMYFYLFKWAGYEE